MPGSGLDVGAPMSDVEIRYYAANPIGCTANGGFPPGYFAGAAALIERGNCTFEEKIDNAEAAGAVLADHLQQSGRLRSAGRRRRDACRRTASCTAEGQAYVGFIEASAPTPVTVEFTPAAMQGDVLAVLQPARTRRR